VHALDGVSFAVEAGSIAGLIGPNGSGKSTAIDCLSGFQKLDGGKVVLAGADITGKLAHHIARAGLMRTFQLSRELRGLTVLENMLLASPHQSGDSAWRCFLRPRDVREEEDAAIARARELLEQVDLWRLANEPAGDLSGGQKKLLEISRALMHQPEIILLDEPAAGVSPVMIQVIGKTILRLRAQGITFAIIEHDMDVIAQLCDPIYVLAEGRTLTKGTFREVSSNRQVMQAYLGKVA